MNLIPGRFWTSQALWMLLLVVADLGFLRVTSPGYICVFVAVGLVVPAVCWWWPEHTDKPRMVVYVSSTFMFALAGLYGLGISVKPPSNEFLFGAMALFVTGIVSEKAFQVGAAESTSATLGHRLMFYMVVPVSAVLGYGAYLSGAAIWFWVGLFMLGALSQIGSAFYLERWCPAEVAKVHKLESVPRSA